MWGMSENRPEKGAVPEFLKTPKYNSKVQRLQSDQVFSCTFKIIVDHVHDLEIGNVDVDSRNKKKKLTTALVVVERHWILQCTLVCCDRSSESSCLKHFRSSVFQILQEGRSSYAPTHPIKIIILSETCSMQKDIISTYCAYFKLVLQKLQKLSCAVTLEHSKDPFIPTWTIFWHGFKFGDWTKKCSPRPMNFTVCRQKAPHWHDQQHFHPRAGFILWFSLPDGPLTSIDPPLTHHWSTIDPPYLCQGAKSVWSNRSIGAQVDSHRLSHPSWHWAEGRFRAPKSGPKEVPKKDLYFCWTFWPNTAKSGCDFIFWDDESSSWWNKLTPVGRWAYSAFKAPNINLASSPTT